MSAPTKPDSEKKHNKTISLDRETADYANVYLQPFSPWVRQQIKEHMGGNREYVKLRAAEETIRLQARSEEAARAFRDTYGIEAPEGKAEAMKALDQAKAAAQAEQKAVEDKRYAEIWRLIKDKNPHQAIAWLQSRKDDYGLKDSPADTYENVAAWAKQLGAD